VLLKGELEIMQGTAQPFVVRNCWCQGMQQ
jgi:hypothetical protein